MATIISHRGYWRDAGEKNRRVAFDRSFGLGFGTETDVRDHSGDLVIAHDPPTGAELSLADLLHSRAQHDVRGPLALNIKADGLQSRLAAALSAESISYFVFDMSVPDTLSYARAGIRYFTRQSEYEPTPSLYEDAAGVWIDCFKSAWVDEDCVRSHLDAGKDVCLVSPELHGRTPESAWSEWASWGAAVDPRFIVCTDRPEDLAKVLPS